MKTRIALLVVSLGLLGACSDEPSAEELSLQRVEAALAAVSADISSVTAQLSVLDGQLVETRGLLDAATAERGTLLETIETLATRIDDLEARQRALLADAVEAEVNRACLALADDPSLDADDEIRFDSAWAEVADEAEMRGRATACAAQRVELIQARAAIPALCQLITGDLPKEQLESCTQIIAQSTDLHTAVLGVTRGAGDDITTILSVDIPVLPGDTLDTSAFFQITNDLGYTVGVGAHLWAKDADQPGSTWFRISSSTGDNVDPARHHMPLQVESIYVVPETWTPQHTIRVAIRADAHSTAGLGDLTVEPRANLIVRVFRG